MIVVPAVLPTDFDFDDLLQLTLLDSDRREVEVAPTNPTVDGGTPMTSSLPPNTYLDIYMMGNLFRTLRVNHFLLGLTSLERLLKCLYLSLFPFFLNALKMSSLILLRDLFSYYMIFLEFLVFWVTISTIKKKFETVTIFFNLNIFFFMFACFRSSIYLQMVYIVR